MTAAHTRVVALADDLDLTVREAGSNRRLEVGAALDVGDRHAGLQMLGELSRWPSHR